MNCRSAEHAMDRALDEAIPGARTEELRAHLARCPGCRRQWEALQAAEAVLRVPRPAPAPDDLLADFRRRLEAERPVAPRRSERPWLSWLWPAGSVAAAGLAAALAITFNLPNAFQMPDTASTVSRGGGRGDIAPSGAPAQPERALPSPKQKQEPRTTDFALAPENRGRPAAKPLGNETVAPRAPIVKSPAAEPQVPAPQDLVQRDKARQNESEVLLGVPLRMPRPDASALGTLSKQLAAAPQPPAGRGIARKQTGPIPEAFRISETLRQTRKEGEEKAPLAPAPPQSVVEFGRGRQESSAAGTTPLYAGTPGARPELDLHAKKKNDLADRPASPGDRYARAKEPITSFGGNQGRFGGFGEGGLAGGGRPLSVASNRDPVDQWYFDAEIREPRELDVSPAVLTALQRPVEVQLQRETLAGAVRQLTEAADVVLSYDPRVAGMAVNVTTPEPQVPLWVVLQEVAQQNNLQIVPRDNQLELQPASPVLGKPAAAAPAPTLPLAGTVAPERAEGLSAAPAGAAPAPAGPKGASPLQRQRVERSPATRNASPRATGERQLTPERRYAPPLRPEKLAEKGEKADKAVKTEPARAAFRYQFEDERLGVDRTAPDRRVWPALWGRLPEWGFALPTPAALPVAVDTEKTQATEKATDAETLFRRAPAPPRVPRKRAPQK